MPITAEKVARMGQYKGLQSLITDHGYITWQVSTGENVEILFIEVGEERKGHGKELIRQMCERIAPYNSVFVFRREGNEDAGHFYRALGFKETPIDGLYKEERAVLATIPYEDLCRNLSR